MPLQDQEFPRIQRDILQVEQLSQKLRAKAVRADVTADTLDASRLLAQEGINPRKLTQALQTFELRPTYEDVFRVETASVDEYLQQVRLWVTCCFARRCLLLPAATMRPSSPPLFPLMRVVLLLQLLPDPSVHPAGHCTFSCW